jgi:methyl-accepting chemotaxis protein
LQRPDGHHCIVVKQDHVHPRSAKEPSFAVMVGEVRCLAQRAVLAAKEVKSLIGRGAEHDETGARLAGEAGATINDIVNRVRQVSSLISEIDSAAR